MTTYNWKFVEDSRTSKQTGKITKKLTFYLCVGNRVLRDTQDMTAAQRAEETLLEKHDFEGPTIKEFWQEQLDCLNSGNPESFVKKYQE
jgi:hypothetical protein